MRTLRVYFRPLRGRAEKDYFPGPAGDGERKDYIQLKIGRRKAASAWSNSGETACFYKSYKRGLLFQSHKRKIGGEENLISAVGIGSWRSPCPMRTNRSCPHNDKTHHGLIIPSAGIFGKGKPLCCYDISCRVGIIASARHDFCFPHGKPPGVSPAKREGGRLIVPLTLL